MRVSPHANAIRRGRLSHGGLEPAHAVCLAFQKNYRLAIHGLRRASRTVSVFVYAGQAEIVADASRRSRVLSMQAHS